MLLSFKSNDGAWLVPALYTNVAESIAFDFARQTQEFYGVWSPWIMLPNGHRYNIRKRTVIKAGLWNYFQKGKQRELHRGKYVHNYSSCNLIWLRESKELACMTGALWAKRGERDISRKARSARRGEEKNKDWWTIEHWWNSKNNGLRTGALFFSSPRLELRAKYRVRPAWLIKRLSCRLAKKC